MKNAFYNIRGAVAVAIGLVVIVPTTLIMSAIAPNRSARKCAKELFDGVKKTMGGSKELKAP